MYTFGREREKEAAGRFVVKPEELLRIHGLVDAIHDALEGTGDRDRVRAAIEECLVRGGSGVWEQAGSWLRKLAPDDPSLLAVWDHVASHKSARVRFRAAAHLSELPWDKAVRLGGQLIRDAGAKVRAKAASELAAHRNAEVDEMLADALEREADPVASESIEYALEKRRAAARAPATDPGAVS